MIDISSFIGNVKQLTFEEKLLTQIHLAFIYINNYVC